MTNAIMFDHVSNVEDFDPEALRWGDPVEWSTIDVQRDVPELPGLYVFTQYKEGHQGAKLPGTCPAVVMLGVPNLSVLYVGKAADTLRGRLRRYVNLCDTNQRSRHPRTGKPAYDSRTGRAEQFPGKHAGSGLLANHHEWNVSKIYVRWAVVYDLEAQLVRCLKPLYNKDYNASLVDSLKKMRDPTHEKRGTTVSFR